MPEAKAKVLNSLWILLTGMLIILGYFLPIFSERRVLPTTDQYGNLSITDFVENFTGYQGLAIENYRPFFVWFIAVVLFSALAIMILSSIQLTGDKTYPILLPVLAGVMTGASFFILLLYSWIGWILETFILLNLLQQFYFERFRTNSQGEKIVHVIILIFLIVLLPTSMALSWIFLPMY